MVMNTLGLSTFIAQNPGLIAWILAGLLTFIASIVSVYHGLLLRRQGTNARHIKELERRMATVDMDIRSHAFEVRQAKSEFRSLGEAFRHHMDREEKEVWRGISDLGERLARIEGELGSIKRAIANGEMAEVLALLRRPVKG